MGTVSDIQNGAGRFGTDSGYWVSIGCITAVLVADTPLGPFALGVLVVALIYQTGLLLKGTPATTNPPLVAPTSNAPSPTNVVGNN